MIKVNNLSKHYNKGKKNEQLVLNDINVEFENTGLVCILGESGSGKTTLLNTIGGLDDFSDGTIDIDGTVVTEYQPKIIEPVRNEHFGYIFQNYYLLQDYSVEYNVKIALGRYDISEKEKDERVDYILNMLGISKYKKKIVSKLSGGQQQRVSIARALVKAPDIIMADEPTGNLDEENTIRTMMILKNISKECLVLLVTHEKRIAEFFADRIIEVCDGKIVRDVKNVPVAYQKSDDSNIYLKEYEEHEISEEYAEFHLYHNDESNAQKVKLNMVWRDGKLYIQNLMNTDIVLEGEENGVKILDEERETIDIEDMENFDYSLERLEGKENTKLSFAQMWSMALSNIKIMGKKQGFIIVILLASAVLLSMTMARFVNENSIDETKIVSTDSNYLKMEFKNVSVFNTKDQYKIFEFAKKNLCDSKYGTAFSMPSINMYLGGKDFAQMKTLGQSMTNFSFVDKKYITAENLVCGKMPEKRDEVVVDKQVINILSESSSVVASLYDSNESYIGSKIRNVGASKNLTIVGICDTKEPAIYCSNNVLLGFSEKGYKIASVDEMKAESDEFSELKLGDNEIYVREGMAKASEISVGDWYYIGDDDTEYTVVGTMPDSYGVDYIMSDKGCKNMLALMIYENRMCYFYTKNKAEAIKYFNKIAKEELDKFAPEITIPHDIEIEEYIKANTSNSSTGKVITLVVVFISLMMIYFTIKSNAVSRSEELTVYRLLGITKGSIIKSYILEIMILTSCTTLPAVLITSGIIKVIAGVPSLRIGMIFPWWSVIILLLCIYIVHTIICILPINSILSKPPAQLAVKG